ncbi:MAG: hypothetical protein MZV64_17565 [Ignavibacteriales bacterium]|nr:hypothetical protein [Ignavibacteriales bacterium]
MPPSDATSPSGNGLEDELRRLNLELEDRVRGNNRSPVAGERTPAGRGQRAQGGRGAGAGIPCRKRKSC